MKSISGKRTLALLAAVLLLGLAMRVAIISRYTYGPNTFSDDNGYLTGGITFANTGYISYENPEVQTTATCVGMPFLVGTLVRLFGYTQSGLMASHIVFSSIGLLSAVAVYLLGSLLHSRLAGLLAAAMCALEPGMATVSCVFLTETPYICLNLFAIYCWIRCSQRWSLRCFWAGVLCMIGAALFKGLALLSVIAALPVLWRRRVPVRRWAGRAAVAALAFVLCFAPWWVRNEILLDRFVMFTANRGDIQLMGSYMGIGCPEGDYDEMVVQMDKEAWEEGYQADVERRFARRGEVGKERLQEWFRTRPVAFVFSHVAYKPFVLITSPLQALPLLPQRLHNALWYAVLLLAAWGLLAARKRSAPDVYAPAWYLLVGVLVTAVYAPLARYSAPYQPLWIVYAAIGASECWRMITARRAPRALS